MFEVLTAVRHGMILKVRLSETYLVVARLACSG